VSGKPKLTKFLLARALGRSSMITEIARELGVSRNTVYRSMKRWGLDTETLLREIATCPDTTAANSTAQPQTPQIQAVKDRDEAAKAKPERNIQRLTAADFTGVNLTEKQRRPRRYY
jgi:transposase-like protein